MPAQRRRGGGAFVSDEIASLLDPTPDPKSGLDNEGADDDAARIIADGGYDDVDDGEFESRGRLRMRGSLDELDERYPSKPISRARWEKQFAGPKSTNGRSAKAVAAAAVEEEEEEEDELGDDDVDDDDDDVDVDDDDDDDDLGADGEEDDALASGDVSDDADENTRPSSKPSGLQAEWAKLEAEESALAQKLAADNARELGQATEAAAQHAAWDQVFNVRIMLHKALAVANQTPEPALRPHFAAHSRELGDALGACAQSALALVAEMLALNGALGVPAGKGDAHAREISRIGAAAADVEPLERVSAAWRVADAQTAAGLRAQLASLDEWSKKAGLSAVAGSERKFKAFQQSVGDQVDAALADPARVLARAHTVRSGKRPLGMRAASRALADGEELLCTHVYDDTDLYHAQLKEFVDRRARGELDNVAVGKHALKRRRREVDRKASKGRKISYEPHPKLQNFMFPVNTLQPVAVHELFAHVFAR